MNYVLGCDIGSQSVKSILLSVEGKLEGEFRSGYGINYPRPTWAEQDPILWLNALCNSIKGLLSQTGIQANQIIGIGLDAQVDGVVGSRILLVYHCVQQSFGWIGGQYKQSSAAESKFEIEEKSRILPNSTGPISCSIENSLAGRE